MIRKLQIQEMASEKFLDIELMSQGLLLVLRNIALKEGIHIELYLDDMKAMVDLLQNRIQEIEILEKEHRSIDDEKE